MRTDVDTQSHASMHVPLGMHNKTKSSYILPIVHLGSTCSTGNLINLHSHMIEKHMILQNSFLFLSVIILIQLQYITALMIKVLFIKGNIKAPNRLILSRVEFTQFT